MAFDPVPWFVGGGALHPAEAARQLTYAVTGGAVGVGAVDDLKITQLPTAGTSVRAASGGAVIPNLYPGASQQSYAGRAASTTDISVTATGSGSGRVDLVIARIDDPQYGGTVPGDVTVGPYIKFAIIQNVASGSTGLPAGLAYPAVALARLDIPASTGTITNAMITDLRAVANPRMVSVHSQAERDALYPTPYDSLQVYRLDTHQLETHNGTSWGPPVRAVSAARTTAAAFYATGTLILAAPSITGDGVKKFKITANFHAITSTGTNDEFNFTIEDSTTSTVLSTRGVLMPSAAGQEAGQCMVTTNVPTAGAHVYKLCGGRVGGTGIATVVAAPGFPIDIIVEQIA
jgi:hypothetical protein